VNRLLRLVLLACLAAVVAPSTGLAASRMFVGFYDDAAFRWRADRNMNLDRARDSHATIINAAVSWAKVAPTRPANASNPFDPAYDFTDLDDLIRGAQMRGIEPMLQIWGTPRWAGPAANRSPRQLGAFTAFTRAVASRYSGRYPGYPFVRYYGVWNEPNLNQFLAPQFDRRGRSIGPALYAKLFKAAYTGIKAGNRLAQVALGETSARGRDRRVRGLQDTHSPGRFYQLVAKAAPKLKFDAVAHHPYPTDPKQRPEQVVRWPNVSLMMLPRLESSLKKWFHRKSAVPIWITEYGHETTPDPKGVSYETQSAYVQRAFRIAARYSYVPIFVWFVLHDDQGDPWQSGLIAEDGTLKPAFFTFANTAYQFDPRNSLVVVKGGKANPVVRLSAREMAAKIPAGSIIGVDMRVILGDTLVAHPQPQGRLGIDGWVSVPVAFTPQKGRTYYVQVEMNDINGDRLSRFLTLVAR
jgi:glycosyl hydrolase family 39 (putative alpha-L-iduronidase)